jgi:hypothetical protein
MDYMKSKRMSNRTVNTRPNIAEDSSSRVSAASKQTFGHLIHEN